MEEKVEKQEQTTVAEMISSFNKRWETVVDLFVELFGLTREAARNTMLVAIVPLLTAAVQIVNWLYLYVHYHVIYNVPMNDLTMSTSWLARFAAIAMAMVIVIYISYRMLKFMWKHMTFAIIIAVILFIISVCLMLIQWRYTVNYGNGIVTALFSSNMSTDEINIVVKLLRIGNFLIKK